MHAITLSFHVTYVYCLKSKYGDTFGKERLENNFKLLEFRLLLLITLKGGHESTLVEHEHVYINKISHRYLQEALVWRH